MWASLVRGHDRPDLIVVDNAYWGLLHGLPAGHPAFHVRSDAKLGFVSIKYMDADVVLDGGIGWPLPVSPPRRCSS